MMSSLSVGDDSLLNNEKVQEPTEETLRPNVSEEERKENKHRDMVEEKGDIESVNLDDEINSILNSNDKKAKAGGDEEANQKVEDEIATQMSLQDLQDLDIGPLDKVQNPMNKIVLDLDDTSKTVSNSQSPNPVDDETYDKYKNSESQADVRRNLSLVPITSEAALGGTSHDDEKDTSKISAYARLDFENFTFFVQTLQVILGRKSNDELLQSSHHAVDVHLSSTKAISRRHAKIFYNFGTQRFELSILGRNGAFVDDAFIEKGITVPLTDGTKIQIGDIPFAFILPSIESNTNDTTAGMANQFNPSDAINLRSNIYKVSELPSKSDKLQTSKASENKQVKDPKSVIDSPSSGNTDTSRHTSRRTSQSKPTSRRSSNVRKKSLASVTNDEIDDILNELGTNSMNAVDEEESELLDSEIQSILNDPENQDQNGEMDLDEENLLKLTEFNKSNEEDEIDKLVKQHNLEQGVTWDEDELDREDGNENEDDIHDIDLDLSVLDQEIATLAPLIDAHHQDLMKEKEEKRKHLEQEKRKMELQQLRKVSGKNLPLNKSKVKPGTSPMSQAPVRSTPLMGKPAIPRMGKPASIQPPASRLYGRHTPINGLSKSQLIDNRLASSSSPLAGLPTHLVAQGSANSGLPLKIAQGTHHSMAHLVAGQMSKPLMPPKPPAPKLEVEIKAITSTMAPVAKTQIQVITINREVELPPVCIPKNLGDQKDTPKIPKRKKDISQIKKTAKSIYTIDEIPEHYRIKPTLSYPLMITNVLKSKGGDIGLTISEINETIKEIYPYYKYCPDGWQASVSHNVTLNKIFKKISKKDYDSGWTWGIDAAYIAEREKVKQKQQELAANKAKAAAIKAEELKQKQRLESQQGATHNIVGRNFASPYGLSPLSTGLRIPQSQFISQLQQKQIGNPPTNGQKPKTIAELASEIRRDGLIGSKAPLYFKPQSTLQVNSSGELVRRNDIPATVSSPATSVVTSQPSTTSNTIKAQLAANRSQSPPPMSPIPQTKASESDTKPKMNQNTKKSLAYLQKELFTLYKARNLSYNTATTTEVITKALATTIAQVNIIGVKAGCGDNALSFLVEKAPNQVSKILDIALTKSIKEKQGTLSSRPASRSGTPGPTTQSLTTSPEKGTSSLSNIKQSVGSPNTSSLAASPVNKEITQEQPSTKTDGKEITPIPINEGSGNSGQVEMKNESPGGSLPLIKPPVYKGGLAKPPTFFGKSESSSPSQPAFSSASYSGSSVPKPQSFSKPSALSKPPQFLSNKPARPAYHGKDEASIPKPPSFTSGSFTPNKNDIRTQSSTTSTRTVEVGENGAPVSTSAGTKRPSSHEDINEESLEENSRKVIKIE